MLFKVTPYRAGLSIVDSKGDVITKIAPQTDASFTVSMLSDKDKTARLYLAHYKEVDGELRLYNIALATLDNSTPGASKTISGIDTTVGKHTVKAFLWSDSGIIDMVEITQ